MFDLLTGRLAAGVRQWSHLPVIPFQQQILLQIDTRIFRPTFFLHSLEPVVCVRGPSCWP